MEKYKVGQVLFLIAEKTTKITPLHIVEEVIRTTIDGSEKTYTVMLPDKERTKVDIKKLKGRLFKSTDTLKTHMINNATIAVGNMVNNAVKISQVAFNLTDEEVANTKVSQEVVQEKPMNDIIKVDLGQGKMAKVNIKNLDKLEAK